MKRENISFANFCQWVFNNNCRKLNLKCHKSKTDSIHSKRSYDRRISWRIDFIECSRATNFWFSNIVNNQSLKREFSECSRYWFSKIDWTISMLLIVVLSLIIEDFRDWCSVVCADKRLMLRRDDHSSTLKKNFMTSEKLTLRAQIIWCFHN